MKNKIFEIKADGETFTICAPNESGAKKHFVEEEGYDVSTIDEIKEIDPYEWESKKIKIYEDNDTETEPYYITYAEAYSDSGYCETIASSVIDY